MLHLDDALALAPSFADALALQAGINTYIGQPAASVPLLRRAMRLNPGAGYLYFLLLGRAYFFLDDSEQALINLREAIARNPTSLEAHIYQAAALLRLRTTRMGRSGRRKRSGPSRRTFLPAPGWRPTR